MDKPYLGFWQIWNMSFGFLGIQFGWGLQMANMSAIYEYLGARPDQIPLLWLAAPLTGLIVQPIIGHMSDRTWAPLGRRRPYFLVGAILAARSRSSLMPNSSRAVDGGGAAVDPGRLDQREHGAVPRLRGRPAARAAAHPGLRDAEPLHRARRGGRVGAALDAHATAFGRREHERRRDDPAERCGSPSTSEPPCSSARCSGRSSRTQEYPPQDLAAFRSAKTASGGHRGTARARSPRRSRRCPRPCGSWPRCRSAPGSASSACGSTSP